jgi:hypothetical protein
MTAEGKIIGQQERVFPYGSLYNYEDKNNRLRFFSSGPITTLAMDIIFPGVDPCDISDVLSVGISSLDGQSAAQAAGQKNISIVTEAEYSRMSKTAQRYLYMNIVLEQKWDCGYIAKAPLRLSPTALPPSGWGHFLPIP